MPYFTATVEVFSLDKEEEYFHSVKEHLQAAVKSAMRAYLQAVLQRIPVRTGFLAGSFANLSELIGTGIPRPNAELQNLFSLIGKNKPEKKTQSVLEKEAKARKQETIKGLIEELKAGARIIQTEKGKKKFRLSQRERNRIRQHIIKLQREEYYYPEKGAKVLKTPRTGVFYTTPLDKILTISEDKVIFEFSNSIIYYRINDFFPGHAPTAPWRSIEAGNQAFFLELHKQVKRFPSITSFLTTTKYSLRKSGGMTKTTFEEVKR